MYLYCYRKRPNFGDVLNDVVWKKFIKAPLSDIEGSEEVFVGIGTLLNERLPKAKVLHIFGSGLGYGSVTGEMMENWNVHFVRGPLTAKALNLDLRYAISDPAILLHKMIKFDGKKDFECSFMPHHAIDSDRFRRICQGVGINYISPESPVADVIDGIVRSKRLITSALHGAIAAEAFRVPWCPVFTNNDILTSKWDDWANAMELDLDFIKLPTIYPKRRESLAGCVAGVVKDYSCGRKLEHISRSGRFVLGRDAVLNDRVRKMQEKIDEFNLFY